MTSTAGITPGNAAIEVRLDPIGDPPFNEVHLMPLNKIESVPENGYFGSVAKLASVQTLRSALAAQLDVPLESLSIGYAGRDLIDDRTFKDNGIVEPGPAARRSGAKVELKFTLQHGMLPGAVQRAAAESRRQEIQRQEAQRQAERDAEAARKKREDAEARRREDGEAREAREARAAANRAAEEAAARRLERQVAADVEAAVPPGPPEVEVPRDEPCVLSFTPIGVGDVAAAGSNGPAEGAVRVETRTSARISEVVEQLHAVLGHAGGELLIVYGGHVLDGQMTVREARIPNGGTIQFFFASDGDGDAAPPALVADRPVAVNGAAGVAPADAAREVPAEDHSEEALRAHADDHLEEEVGGVSTRKLSDVDAGAEPSVKRRPSGS